MNILKQLFGSKRVASTGSYRQNSTPLAKQAVKQDTQFDGSKLENSLSDWPVIKDQSVQFSGQQFSLVDWITKFKSQEVFTFSLPEIDYGEPRFPAVWPGNRSASECKSIEHDYIEHISNYSVLLADYHNRKKVFFEPNGEYNTSVASLAWLKLAPKYKMLRREFVNLTKSMEESTDLDAAIERKMNS